jgi:hypothetical protein
MYYTNTMWSRILSDVYSLQVWESYANVTPDFRHGDMVNIFSWKMPGVLYLTDGEKHDELEN